MRHLLPLFNALYTLPALLAGNPAPRNGYSLARSAVRVVILAELLTLAGIGASKGMP